MKTRSRLTPLDKKIAQHTALRAKQTKAKLARTIALNLIIGEIEGAVKHGDWPTGLAAAVLTNDLKAAVNAALPGTTWNDVNESVRFVHTHVPIGAVQMWRRKLGGLSAPLGAGVQWHFAPELPDDETRVMFAAGEEVEVGYHADGRWLTDSETIFEESDVYAWAHLPAAPDVPEKGGAP